MVHGLRSIRSRAAKEEVSSHREVTCPPIQYVPAVWAAPSVEPTPNYATTN